MLLGRDRQPGHLIKVPDAEREITVIEAPSARRLLIGTALRRYREDLGFILDDAARVLECDRSKISVRHYAHCFIARKAGRDERRYLWVQCLTGA
jgi:hypothetical protein